MKPLTLCLAPPAGTYVIPLLCMRKWVENSDWLILHVVFTIPVTDFWSASPRKNHFCAMFFVFFFLSNRFNGALLDDQSLGLKKNPTKQTMIAQLCPRSGPVRNRYISIEIMWHFNCCPFSYLCDFLWQLNKFRCFAPKGVSTYAITTTVIFQTLYIVNFPHTMLLLLWYILIFCADSWHTSAFQFQVVLLQTVEKFKGDEYLRQALYMFYLSIVSY